MMLTLPDEVRKVLPTMSSLDQLLRSDSMFKKLWIVALCASLTGCASYEAHELIEIPLAPVDLAHLTVDARSLSFPVLATHRFDPLNGLDAIEVAMLAVVNNGDLRLARDDAGIAEAQAFSAGLLPDPQLALSHDLSNTIGLGGVPAYSYGLNYDINALLMHSSQQQAAGLDVRKADLNLLWQEWQVVAQARMLFVKQIQGGKALRILQETQALFADRQVRLQSALARGLLSADTLAPNLAALQDVQRQVFDMNRQMNQGAHDLNALLGLPPATTLVLHEGADSVLPDAARVAAALPALSARRPDLRALQAGYQAQDQRYRGALLAQFPALNIGLTRARDSSSVYSNALGVTLTLPFLNRNRGNIAIEKATRRKLFDEYQLRIQTSRNDIDRLLAEQALNLRQMARLDVSVADMRATLRSSEIAYLASQVDLLAYTSARAALLARQLERINLEQAMLEQRVALETLLGVDPTTPAPSRNENE